MTFRSSSEQTNLTQQTVKGIFWSYLSFIGGKGMTFLSTVILARLLLPEQFGLIGYCLVATQYLDILNAAGVDSALIARRDRLEEAANAAFTANIFLGLSTFAAAWVIAPYVAQFFNEPAIIPLLRVLALTLPISGLGMVPDTLIQRSLRFRTRLIPDVSRSIAKGVISIVLAVAGMGVWSLVWGQIAGAAAGTVLAWLLAGWRPTWRFHSESTRSMLVFGFHIIIIELVGAIRNNVDYLLVGRILGAVALGYYTMAFRIPELLIGSLNNVVGTVSFPALVVTQSDSEKMRSFYFGYIRYLALFVFPIGVGLTLTAHIFIPVLLSSKWVPAIVPTALISSALAIMAIGYVPGVLYKVINRPQILNQLAIIKVPMAVAVLWYSTRWGINGVAAGQIVIGLVSVTLDTLVANHVMGYRIFDLARAVFPSLASSLAMALILATVDRVFVLSGFGGFSILVILGVATYAGILFLISRETINQGLVILGKAFRTGPQSGTLGASLND
jgi:lipopolysaccharide exporter